MSSEYVSDAELLEYFRRACLEKPEGSSVDEGDSWGVSYPEASSVDEGATEDKDASAKTKTKTTGPCMKDGNDVFIVSKKNQTYPPRMNQPTWNR